MGLTTNLLLKTNPPNPSLEMSLAQGLCMTGGSQLPPPQLIAASPKEAAAKQIHGVGTAPDFHGFEVGRRSFPLPGKEED